MSNTYSWKIDALKCAQDPQPNYVAVVEWTATGTNGAQTAVVHGTSTFSPDKPKIEGQQFLSYSSLTEETVLQWIYASESVSDIEATLDNQLSNLANPPVGPQTADLPWAKD